MAMMSTSYSSRGSVWRMNDWSSLFDAQRRLFQKENKVAKEMAKIGLTQRAEVQKLLVEAQLLWEAAQHYQQRAKDAHAAGNPILAQVEMLEARRLAYQYQRVTDEAQRLITEAQALALAEREAAAMDRRRLRQEYAVRAMHFM